MAKGSTRKKQGKAAPRRQTTHPLPWPEFPLSPRRASGRWYKKLAGNRLHADRQAYTGRSEAYE